MSPASTPSPPRYALKLDRSAPCGRCGATPREHEAHAVVSANVKTSAAIWRGFVVLCGECIVLLHDFHAEANPGGSCDRSRGEG